MDGVAEKLAEMRRAVANQAHAAVRKGTLTPEAAFSLWVQDFEIMRLGEKLAAGERAQASADPLTKLKLQS